MTVLHLDFETRGVLDLREVGLHRYARHPDTDVWCMAWAFDDGEVGLTKPEEFPYVMRAGRGSKFLAGTVVAHNAPFELEIWNQIMVPRYGWPVLRPEQTYCTMAQAYAMGLPGALEDAALALGLKFLKDTEGRALMLRMARPRRLEDGRPIWWDEPEKLARLYEYCRQDVRVERALGERLLPLSNYERRVWLMDYRINQRGILADLETASAAVSMSEKVKEAGDQEIARITNGEVQTHSALLAFKGWIADHGVPAAGLAKQDIVELLDEPNLPADVRRALTIRQEIGKASVAKLKPMLNIAGDDNRVRQIIQYHGAATGRFAGRKLQPHNFPRDLPDAEEVEHMLELVRAGDPQVLALAYGPPISVISRCLRSFFLAPPGKRLIAGDFSAVEGRGTAWISGEEWKLQAYRAADAGGPGVYETNYARSFGVPVETVKNPSPERQIGKVQELLLCYGGGVGALRRGGGALVASKTDAELDEWKLKWRGIHRMVVQTWKQLETAAVSAVRQPGTIFAAGYGDRGVKFKVDGSFLWCLLPSERCICYPYPKLLAGKWGDQLTYMTMPSAEDTKKGKVIADPGNSPKWARVATYGGSLMENVVQALCRDLLVDVMLRLDDAGAAVVLHVHDEAVIEVDEVKAERARAAMAEIMCSPPAWAKDFPLTAKPAIMRRYGKS